MADFKEKLQNIQRLRKQRDDCDERLYISKLELYKIENLLRRRERRETRSGDRKEMHRIRERMGPLEGELQKLSRQLNEIDILLHRVRENETQILFLKNKIAALEAELRKAEERLKQEKSARPPNGILIEKLEAYIGQQRPLSSELKYSFENIQREKEVLSRQRQEALTKKERIDARKKQLQNEIKGLEEEAFAVATAEDTAAHELKTKRDRLKDEYERNKNEIAICRDRLHRGVEGIYLNPHPREVLAEFNDNIPFLLLPVRVETRFINAGQGSELWLRIYPDDIAIHTHEKFLTDLEVAEGIKYWKELFHAEKTGGDQREDRKKTAWSNLASLFGPQRSAWIAQQTRPTNWSSDLSGIATADQLVFPQHDHTKTNAWSRAPRTKILPDKFVVMLYEGNNIVREEVGQLVPDELFVGPDPFEADEAFQNRSNKLLFGESFDWTSDFNKAVQLGMGFKIPLTATQATNGFDKILVLGVYLSADETESKQALENLIDNHHYSPKGFSIVLQGAPTNNTERDGSGYTTNDPFNNISYFVETGDPLFAAYDDCDGRNLADALGIEYDTLQHISNAGVDDYRQAVMMNKALYPATLGYFLETLLQPVLAPADLDRIRDFFVGHVTGRGPSPAIRVGDQPYGVLLTSDFGKWKWNEAEPFFNGSFLRTLYSVLIHYERVWDSLLGELMHVGKAGKDPSEVLMNILGLQASSVSFHQRTGYSTDYLKNLDDFQYGGRYADDMAKTFFQKNELLNFFTGFGYDTKDEAGFLKVPQALRLVYQHYSTLLDAANLIDNVPLSEKDPIRYYDEAGEKNYLHWLAQATSIETLEQQDFGTGKTPPNTLLYLQLRRALLLQLHKTTVRWFKKHDMALDHTLAATNFYNIRPQGDLTKYEVMKAKVGAALPEHSLKDVAASDYLLTAGRGEEEAEFLNEMKASLKMFANIPTSKLERCFTEHLDACTYRLDAWQTAIFRLRLLKQRNLFETSLGRASVAAPGDSRKRGIYLGSYGWLENIRPISRLQVVSGSVPEKLIPPDNQPLFEYADNGGFVHTPSLNHAPAAAILRSGYLSHANTANPDLMAVNLSSERVRRAIFVLQGMRNGQPLEALLGYQFERGLHDRASVNDALKKLNLYIYDFRDKFPYEQHQIRQQGSTGIAIETIPARNVVNGVSLAESTAAFPYGATGTVTTATSDEQTAIDEEKSKLSDTLDAVKDLLLSESAYQMVQGNFDRAGAVMNALRDAQIPPELEVIKTPRSSRFTFTNRVTIQFENADPDLVENNPWSPVVMTPRSKIETGLNKWLGHVLGHPDDIVYRVAHLDAEENEIGSTTMTASDLGLQPIDIVYITGTELNTGAPEENKEARTAASELETRIAYLYRQINALDDEVVVRIEFLRPEIANKKTFGQMLPLIRMLKSMITDSRHLNAKDFDPPSKESMADPGNPEGYDAVQLQGRIETSALLFKSYLDELETIGINATVNDKNNAPQTFSDLKTTFAAMEVTKVSFAEILFTFSGADAAHLQDVLARISGFGLSDAFPQRLSSFANADQIILLDQARNVARKANAALSKAGALVAEASGATEVLKKAEKYLASAKALFGDVFNILPLFSYNNVADIQQSNADRTQLLKHATDILKMNFVVDEWLENVSHVRPRLGRWDYIRTLTEALNDGLLELKPVQLPYRAKDSWLAVEFPEMDEITGEPFNILHDTLCVTIHGDAAFSPAEKQSGLLIDDWTEVIPAREEITGIAFHYNQPNACPPQALLLAVTPQEKGHWEWDDLVGILNDTLQRAKRRAIDPGILDNIKRPEVSVLLPSLVADFSQYDLNISLDYRLNLQHFAATAPVVTVSTRMVPPL